MRKQKIIGALLCLGFLYACSPKIKTVLSSGQQVKSLAYDSEVYVYSINESVPDGVIKIAQISLGDTGFTLKCNYETMLEKAKQEARKVGANVLKITQHKTPSLLGSTCHRLKVTLYKSDALDLLEKHETSRAANYLGDVEYALLHVYRYSGGGSMINYNLKLGDATLCRVKNNFKTTIKIKKEGLNRLTAKTESKTELPFDVVFGKEYFLRCSLKIGAFVGRPKLEFVSYQNGKVEFENFKAKRDETRLSNK